MTLILRKQHAQDRIEERQPPPDWTDDDYAVVDEMLVGRIYRQQMQGDIKLRRLWWCMQDRTVERRGLAGALPFGPSDLIDALAVDLFGAQCQIQLLADHRAHESADRVRLPASYS
jgi:hypothetical protein